MDNQLSFFDLTDRYSQLSKKGDPLERLDEVIDWKEFDDILAYVKKKGREARECHSNAGRKSFGSRTMLKVLVLKHLYNLSFEQVEYQLKDRLSFMRFVGVGLNGTVPDENTVRNYFEQYKETGAWDKLIRTFDKILEKAGYKAQEGSIVDASIVEAPRQRNTPEENRTIKEGNIPEEWEKVPNKLRQKDTDARWVQKRGQNYFGYKLHTLVDVKHKFVRKAMVTDASVHDSNVYGKLTKGDKNDVKRVHADSGYLNSKDALPQTYEAVVCEKGYRNHPLTDEQKRNNRKKSHIRARVEHVYGFIFGSMGLFIRTIGMARAKATIRGSVFVYNISRFATLVKGPKRPREKCAQPA